MEIKDLFIKKGNSLEQLGYEAGKSPVVIFIGEQNRVCLLKKVSPDKAEVLYRETKDENDPSRGYLKLENYILTSERIWSEDAYDIQNLGERWEKELNSVGII